MRISEVEIYSSKQIDAFVEYLKILSAERKAIEDLQAQHTATNALANCHTVSPFIQRNNL